MIAHTPSGFLESGDAREYIERRTRAVEAKRRLPFSDRAVERIDEIAHGVPIHIAKLCELSLLYAKAGNQIRVERVEVEKAAVDLFEILPRAPHTIPAQSSMGFSALKNTISFAGLLLCASSIFWGTMKVGAMVPFPTHQRAEAPISPNLTGQVQHTGDSVAQAKLAPSAAVQPARPVNLNEHELFPNEASAWVALGTLWGETAFSGDLCATAQRALLQCYRTSQVSLDTVKQLNRPGIVTLRGAGSSNAWALLSALSEDTATLQFKNQSVRVPVASLLEVWQGDFSTLWRLPPGQPSRITDGRTGPAGIWLGQRIEELQAAGKVPDSAPQITARVKALQLASGLDVIGIAGPLTFMQVNLASGVKEPRLY